MPTSPTFVIVGGGLAGAKAAETLRAEGFGGHILLLAEEAGPPYERPPLSKAYLRGETDRDSLHLQLDGFYAAHDIELHPSTPVRSIDPAGRVLELASGEGIGYDRLLLGTRVAGFGGHGRVEHWANALNQGPAAARNMLGIATPYERLPYFYSDQYDLGMEYSGLATAWDQVVFAAIPQRTRSSPSGSRSGGWWPA